MAEQWRRRDSCGLWGFSSFLRKKRQLDSFMKTFPHSPPFHFRPASPRSTSRSSFLLFLLLPVYALDSKSIGRAGLGA